LSETKEAIKKLYPLGIPILLNGATSGKTSVVEEVAEELGLPLIVIRLSMEHPHYIGSAPKIIPEADYFVKVPNKDYLPAFESGAVIFFDELNRSDWWVRNAVMSVFFERTLGGKKLHPATLVIGAVTIGKVYRDVDVMDKALLARFAIINVVPSTDEILNYLSERYPFAASIIERRFEEIAKMMYEENRFERLNPTLTPRNLEFAFKVIETYHNDPFLRKLLYTVISPGIADILLAELDISPLIRSILAGQDVEVEKEKVSLILTIISTMPLKDNNEFLNAIRFAKKIYKELGLEDGIIVFLFNLASRNRDLFIRNITYIKNEFPNLKDELSL
jgi:hypothetical protein